MTLPKLPKEVTKDAFFLLVAGLNKKKGRKFHRISYSQHLHKLYMGFIKELHRSGF